MKSMTGTGAAKRSFGSSEVAVEIRTVNHRYRDFNVRLPIGYGILEDAIRRQISAVVSRGHIEVDVKAVFVESQAGVSYSAEVAKSYIGIISQVTAAMRDAGLAPGPTDVSAFLALPGVIEPALGGTNIEEALAMVSPALQDALAMLDESRSREGEALKKDLMLRLAAIDQARKDLVDVTGDLAQAYLQTLKERLDSLAAKGSLPANPVSEERMAQEMLIYADRISVAEELTRLAAHVDNFSLELQREMPVGRTLDFLVQEINREANTIASKSNSFEASLLSVKIKSELEKIREQVQNIE